MDYSELIAEVSERSGIPGFSMRAEQLTRMAESELNKELLVGQQEATATLTTGADKTATLPTDFIQMRRAAIGDKELRHWSLDDIQNGTRTGYAVRGGVMITSLADQAIDITYYRGLPPLSLDFNDFDGGDFDRYDFATDATTNWLLDSDPELYVYALLKQWLAFKLDERAATADSYLDRLVSERNALDIKARFSGVQMSTRGPTP